MNDIIDRMDLFEPAPPAQPNDYSAEHDAAWREFQLASFARDEAENRFVAARKAYLALEKRMNARYAR